MPASPHFKIHGTLLPEGGGVHLRWKPVRGARSYEIEWKDKSGQWRVLEYLQDQEIAPDGDGLIEYLDPADTSLPVGGTYRVVARLDERGDGKKFASAPLPVFPPRPRGSGPADLRALLRRRKTPVRIRSLITGLKWKRGLWTMLLPREVGTFLSQRIEVEVQASELTGPIIDLLEALLLNLPKLASRAERALAEYGAEASLDETDRLDRACIVIDPPAQSGSSRAWTLIVGVKNSDYAWHIQFAGTRFKEIWAGS